MPNVTLPFDRIYARRILLAAVIPTADAAGPVARAALEGGLNVMEVSFRNPDAAECMRRIRAEVPDMQVGAGTILTPAQVREAVAAGAQIAVSPGFNPTIVKAARDAGLPFIPGVATPGEMEQALELGCSTVKFFPAEPLGGPRFLLAVAAPYAHTALRIIPLGGVGQKNMADYLAVPLVVAVGGSWIAGRELIHRKDWFGITTLAREALALAATVST
jgi:2-dehydro-3-deoxyphosphogluconate aldolase/(4S)-4-hydroxy-2-oxoglutarate aldolase